MEPISLGAGRTATAISAGHSHTCAILDDGTVKCWGNNSLGQLGQDNNTLVGNGIGTAMADLDPINLGPGRTATAISAGGLQTCAILDDGTVKCWGNNGWGQLGQDNGNSVGNASGTAMADLDPINLGPGRTAAAISTGGNHTCAILDNGTVKCWGLNFDGQLGQDHTTQVGGIGTPMADLDPINLGPGRTATAISTGGYQTCAILDNGTAKCWGLNHRGQLGQDNTTSAGNGIGTAMADLDPINLGPGRTATAISTGYQHTCALLDNATVKCFGENEDGQLGQGDTTDVGDGSGTAMADLDPIDFGAGRTPLATAINQPSDDGVTCVLFSDETMSCFGNNDDEQLGLGISDVSYGHMANQMGDDLPAIDLDHRIRPIQVECPTAPHHGFPDLSGSSYADVHVTCMKELAITTGTNGGTLYSPADFVTREQMAAFIARV